MWYFILIAALAVESFVLYKYYKGKVETSKDNDAKAKALNTLLSENAALEAKLALATAKKAPAKKAKVAKTTKVTREAAK